MRLNISSISVAILTTMPLFNGAIAADFPEYELAITNTALHTTIDPTPLITLQGSYVRMVTYTNENDFKTTDTTLGTLTWTAVESELKPLCMQYVAQHHPTHKQLTLWLAQLVGVSPYQTNAYRFVVMDVPIIQAYYGAPASGIGIFRPCTDPRIGPHADGSPICPAQMNLADTHIASDYKTWFINNSMTSYTLTRETDDKNHYIGAPWTGYGYTYNWNPEVKSVYGVSEFVVLKNTPITVLPHPKDPKTPYLTPEEYCAG